MYAENNGGVSQLDYGIYCNTTSSYLVGQTGFGPLLTASWQRLYASFVVPSGCTSINVYVFLNEATTVNAYIWQAQLNLGAVPTTLIPTTSTAVSLVHATAAQSSFFTNLYNSIAYPLTTFSKAGTVLTTCAVGIVGAMAVVSDATSLTPGTAYVPSAGSPGTDTVRVQCALTGSTYAWQTM